MSRICDVTGKKPMFGNNVSHAKNKTKEDLMLTYKRKDLVVWWKKVCNSLGFNERNESYW